MLLIGQIELEELLKQQEQGLKKQNNGFSEFRLRPILLYGAGNLGKKFCRCLQENQIGVQAFIDRAAAAMSIDKIPVYTLDSPELAPWKAEATVILAGLFSLQVCRAIKKQLADYGFRYIYALHEVNLQAINSAAFCKNLFIGDYVIADIYQQDRAAVLQAFSLFQTEQERNLYFQYIEAYLTQDFTNFAEPAAGELQYLAHDIPVEKDYSNFIDCGAFDGDTLRSLQRQGMKIKNYVAFEPQNQLCEKIATQLRTGRRQVHSAVIFPCGAHSSFAQLKFSAASDGASAARLNNAGSEIVQCVAMDDVLPGFAPTFIKMDIEGAEVAALQGARRMIQKYHPQLAICVYHDLSHLWRIPLMIQEFYPGYHFYLRNYQFMGLETVVYAFPGQEAR